MPENPRERKEFIMRSRNPFSDARGRIDNYELVSPVNMANTITSKAGSIRANHYHPEQLQQCLLISGKYISVFKDLSVSDSLVHSQIIHAGDLAVMPPMVAHTMIFVEDSVFINLVGGNRDHDKFGQHTVPFVLVKPEEAQSYLEKHKAELQNSQRESKT
jgi:dTDP-4-dehydrorhamnose 3,5-epimerase-like enzyme